MKKSWFKYFLFALVGFILDETLKYYHINLPYSFMILFTNISLYKIRYKEMTRNNQITNILLKAFAFIILPIIYSLLT